MWMLWRHSKSSPPIGEDFFRLYEHNMDSIQNLANDGNLLNQRQCQDLSSKLSQTAHNIRELVGASADPFRPALENLLRYLEKAKLLVTNCGDEDWCVAAVFQIQNENAFREILLEVGLCYNVIYEHAKSTSKEWKVHFEDLRESSVFLPASTSDILLDQQDLQKRLDDLANDFSSVELLGQSLLEEVALKQCLARYLLLKLKFTSEQSQANTLDACSAILWRKDNEPPGTWGNHSRFLGGGAGASGVCDTKWMGIPCAKKDFHLNESERFFLQEAGILAHLKHPSIVNFFCCGNGLGRGDRFIAMELMEKSLFDLIEDQKGEHFSLPVVVDIMVQMARGMCYLHDQGVAHRDLKPQNVVVNNLTSPHLSDHFIVKLVDFGLSKTKVKVSKSNTISVRGVGTTRYRAPEVHPKAHSNCKGKANWFKADVFSFAMTCVHLLSLKTPFGGMERLSELYNELMNGLRPKLPIDCPQEIIQLLRDCWDSNPLARPSFLSICTRLENFRHKLLRGFSTLIQETREERMDFDMSFKFIKLKSEKWSSIQKLPVDNIDDEEENVKHDPHGNNKNDKVLVIPCTGGHVLEFLKRPSCSSSGSSCSSSSSSRCSMCWEMIKEEAFYHCEPCNFDAHQDCAKIKDKVFVFFHDDPLHLLAQNYYDGNPDAICRFCEESVQFCTWVYRCELCDFNVHAFCTKYPKKIKYALHPYPLTLVQSSPRKSLSCTCCNGDVSGYIYTCAQKRCPLDLHPLCTISPRNPLCTFDTSHRLLRYDRQKGFCCGICGTLGFSWFYHCKHCEVDIHLDCVDDIEEEDDDWNEAYHILMREYETKDDHSKMCLISELLDRLLVTEASSSSSRLRTDKRVQPTIHRLSSTERPSFDDANLCRKIVADTAERKAKKKATKESRQKLHLSLKAEQDTKLEYFEKVLHEMQNSKIMSQVDAEVLVATLEKLKRRQYMVHEEEVKQVQSTMRQGPSICLFYKWKEHRQQKELLTSLVADNEVMYFALLCEEPGHEHIVDRALYQVEPSHEHIVDGALDQLARAWSYRGQRERLEPLLDSVDHALDQLERGHKHIANGAISGGLDLQVVPWWHREERECLQPLLDSGLHVVARAVSTLPGQITQLDYVTLPNLGTVPWDLRAIDLDKHGKQSRAKYKDEENLEVLKRTDSDSAANRLLSFWGHNIINMFEDFGLVRVLYKVTDKDIFPHITQGTLRWLCAEHLHRNLRAGTVEYCPVKRIYHDLEYDLQHQYF